MHRIALKLSWLLEKKIEKNKPHYYGQANPPKIRLSFTFITHLAGYPDFDAALEKKNQLTTSHASIMSVFRQRKVKV